jgi:antitoxin PrlF
VLSPEKDVSRKDAKAQRRRGEKKTSEAKRHVWPQTANSCPVCPAWEQAATLQRRLDGTGAQSHAPLERRDDTVTLAWEREESGYYLLGQKMQTSRITSKGQVTIPAEMRKRLGLEPGDQVGFILDDDGIRVVPREHRIEAAFGLCKAKVSVTDEDMERVIRKRGDK